jgi:hypothetical protein
MRRKLPAWLAILAMALHGLWPLMAQAKPRDPNLLVPLCTINGVTHYVELPASKTPLEQRSALQHEHCKLCFFGAAKLALPPASATPLLEFEATPAERIASAPADVSSSGSYPPALPRAPPILS